MTDILLEAAAAADRGTRARQEDAMLAQFIRGEPGGMAILSDGMGGHGDGDLAARVIVSEAFARLSRAMVGSAPDAAAVPNLLTDALEAANAALRDTVRARRGEPGMGGTMIAALIADGRLHWVSVGDSGLYLLRDGALRRLNADHSMGAQIDALVARGMVSPEAAARHPHRACLTSALTGGTVAHVDCPDEGVALAPGDVVLLVSDGVLAQGTAPLTEALVRAQAGPPPVPAGHGAEQSGWMGDPRSGSGAGQVEAQTGVAAGAAAGVPSFGRSTDQVAGPSVERSAGHPAGQAAGHPAGLAGQTAAQAMAHAAVALAAACAAQDRDNASAIVVTVADLAPGPQPAPQPAAAPQPAPAFWRRALARPRRVAGAPCGEALS